MEPFRRTFEHVLASNCCWLHIPGPTAGAFIHLLEAPDSVLSLSTFVVNDVVSGCCIHDHRATPPHCQHAKLKAERFPIPLLGLADDGGDLTETASTTPLGNIWTTRVTTRCILDYSNAGKRHKTSERRMFSDWTNQSKNGATYLDTKALLPPAIELSEDDLARNVCMRKGRDGSEMTRLS